MSDLPSTTLELAARAVLSHPWGSGPWSAHSEHRFDIECAVCQGDMRRVLAVGLAATADHAHQLANSHGGEHDALRQRYADALWQAAEYAIVAEWICCDPVRPDHELCQQGDAVRQVIRSLIFDAPVTERVALPDAVLAVRDAELERLRERVAELERIGGNCSYAWDEATTEQVPAREVTAP